jgi:hypothetical protein
MTATPDLSVILQDLAAGRIDPSEAARRIDALSASRTPGESGPPTSTEPARDGVEPDSGPGQRDASDSRGPEAEVGGTEAPATERRRSEAPDAEDRTPGEPEDVWAAATDRPQHATHHRDSFRESAARTESENPQGATPTKDTPPGRAGVSGVTRISVRAVGRRVRIIGESTVSTLSADGPHVLRRNGSVLEVSSDGEMGFSLDGFSILRAPRSLDDIRSLGLGKELFLRVNPSIVVDVEVTAGSLTTERVPNLGKVRVTAGSGKLLDVAQVADALVQAGSATVKGAITSGRSRIRAESGTLNIQLADHSDVTVHTEAQLGNVTWSGGHTGSGHEVVMGNGSARLDVEVVMGHAQVRVGSDVSGGVG